MYVGQTRAAGFAKEDTVGTLKTPPTTFIPYIPPESFQPAIMLLQSISVRGKPDRIAKAAQGPGELKGMKMKWEVEPENIGNTLMAALGVDTLTEYAQYVVSNANNKIDWNETGVLEPAVATVANGTYPMGQSSADVGSLCAAIKTAMDAGGTHTYTVTYSRATKKLTIAPNTGNIQMLFGTGVNAAASIRDLIGFSHADTAVATTETSDGTTAAPAIIHNFTRLQSSDQLPSYSFWVDSGTKFKQVAGCMLNQFKLAIAAKEFVTIDADWTGLGYDDTGAAHAPTYSPLNPFVFNQAQIKVDDVVVADYDNVTLTVDNFIKADHVLGGSIYPGKIYSEGHEVSIEADLIVEDATQYNKFLAGTPVKFEVILTHGEDIIGAVAGTKYQLDVVLPVVWYTAAPFPNEQGVLKIKFSGKAVFDSVSDYTSKWSLRNSVVTSY